MTTNNDQEASISKPIPKSPDQKKKISPFKAANYASKEVRSKTKSPKKFEEILNDKIKIQSNLKSLGIGNNNNLLNNGFHNNHFCPNFKNQSHNNNKTYEKNKNIVAPLAITPIREKKREKSTYRDKIMERANQLDREEKIKEEEVTFKKNKELFFSPHFKSQNKKE